MGQVTSTAQVLTMFPKIRHTGGQGCLDEFLLNSLLPQNTVPSYFENYGYITPLNWCFNGILFDDTLVRCP